MSATSSAPTSAPTAAVSPTSSALEGPPPLAVMASGGDSGGSFQLSLQSAEALADVMITRWNSETGKEYHHDPHGSSWTWVSPDLWFEPAAGGDFVVKVRLHNKGGKRAESVGCVVEYRPGAAAAPAAPWLPILDASGAVQHIEDEHRIRPDP